MAKSTRKGSSSKIQSNSAASDKSEKVSEEKDQGVEEAVAGESNTEEISNSDTPNEAVSVDQPTTSPQLDPSSSESNDVSQEVGTSGGDKKIEGKTEVISQNGKKSDESMPVEEDTGSNGGSGLFKKIILKIIILLVVFILGMAAGGLIIHRIDFVNSNKVETSEKVEIKESEEPSPTSVPAEVQVDLKKYKIEVLNGSETKGAAGVLNDTLATEGYNVLSPGNATSSSFAKTVVSAREEVDGQFLKALEDFLSESYSLVVDRNLDEDIDADVVVTIGEK